MRILKTLALLLALSPALALAHDDEAVKPTPFQPKVTEVMTKALNDYPGKEIVLITVDYPPGAGENRAE